MRRRRAVSVLQKLPSHLAHQIPDSCTVRTIAQPSPRLAQLLVYIRNYVSWVSFQSWHQIPHQQIHHLELTMNIPEDDAAYAQDPEDSTWSLRVSLSRMPAFEYQALHGDEIRLLHVHPATSFHNPLILELRHIKLSRRPQYAALSYTWGSPADHHSLILNQTPFKITPNLDHALRSFRSTGWEVIWVDAICINQSDVDERSQQVSMMWQIYSQAKCVFVDLGSGGWRAPLVVELM